jgi:transposase
MLPLLAKGATECADSDEQTSHMFSSVVPEQRVRADHPLRAIRRMTDEVLTTLSPRFDQMYSDMGRPSIPPEQLLRALVLQALYTVRSERLLMEEIDYSILFRWFVGLGMDEDIWSPTTFSKNRDRLLEGDIAAAFLMRLSVRRVPPICSPTSISPSTAPCWRRGRA